jgi:hypothetical protein
MTLQMKESDHWGKQLKSLSRVEKMSQQVKE